MSTRYIQFGLDLTCSDETECYCCGQPAAVAYQEREATCRACGDLIHAAAEKAAAKMRLARLTLQAPPPSVLSPCAPGRLCPYESRCPRCFRFMVQIMAGILAGPHPSTPSTLLVEDELPDGDDYWPYWYPEPTPAPEELEAPVEIPLDDGEDDDWEMPPVDGDKIPF